jgi:chromosome segregation ATPase
MASPREMAHEALNMLHSALEDSENLVAELKADLARERPTESDIERRLSDLENQLEIADSGRTAAEQQAGQFEELIKHANARIEHLKSKLEVAEGGSDKVYKKEVNFWRAKAESFVEESAQYKSRLADLRQKLSSRDEELDELRTSKALVDTDINACIDADNGRVELEREMAQLTDMRDQANQQRETAEAELGAVLTQRDQAHGRVVALGSELDTANARLTARDAEAQELTAKNMLLESATLRLQENFSKEKERAENLGEVVNSHQDELDKSKEQYNKFEELYEEADKRLRKLQHFERLVNRRKSVVTSLIAAVRAKSKSNDALKAGLDSMRRYKSTAQQTEQHLLVEIEQLKAAIGAANEAAVQLREENIDKRKQAGGEQRVRELEERVNTQAELVNSMEEEAQLAKVIQSDLTQKAADAENALRQLRDSHDSAATSLNAIHNNDPLVIDALEQEISRLREQLASGAGEHSAQAIEVTSNEKAEELAQAEAAIKELTFEVAAWKRKYEFLSTDAPAAYQSQTALEK